MGDAFKPDMVAGHSLGEFSALVVAGALSFEDGLRLVSKRALAMQKACEKAPSTMAAVIGLPNEKVEALLHKMNLDDNECVICANYNCPGQIVISGSLAGIDQACEIMQKAGARRALKLRVGGGFHSSFMESARQELSAAIEGTEFKEPLCPIYQNVDAKPYTDAESIKKNLTAQLTAPVLWQQSVENMIADGADSFLEIGPGKVLRGLVSRINKTVALEGLE